MGDLAQVVALSAVAPIELPNGSWSRMLVTEGTVGRGNRGSLGYSVFTPGTTLAPVCHECEEFAFVVQGEGELLLDDRTLPFAAGDALYIPDGVWHAVSNTGDGDAIMVFGFPHPDYPPTERRG
jgi:quercetin dioxygenase-like cupin family protein